MAGMSELAPFTGMFVCCGDIFGFVCGGLVTLMNLLFLRVTRPEPSICTWYWRFGRDFTILPVLYHLPLSCTLNFSLDCEELQISDMFIVVDLNIVVSLS